MTFRIIDHIPGRIKIEVPFIKKTSVSELLRLSKDLSNIGIPEGIKDISLSPISRNIVITYDYGKIDIIQCIKNVLSSIDVQKFSGGKD